MQLWPFRWLPVNFVPATLRHEGVGAFHCQTQLHVRCQISELRCMRRLLQSPFFFGQHSRSYCGPMVKVLASHPELLKTAGLQHSNWICDVCTQRLWWNTRFRKLAAGITVFSLNAPLTFFHIFNQTTNAAYFRRSRQHSWGPHVVGTRLTKTLKFKTSGDIPTDRPILSFCWLRFGIIKHLGKWSAFIIILLQVGSSCRWEKATESLK